MKKSIKMLTFLNLAIQLFFALLIAIIISGCKKGNLTYSYSWKFSPTALAYVELIPDKYLIYKDSASGELDSVIVTNSMYGNKLYHDRNGNSLYTDYFSLTLTEFNPVHEVWFTGAADANSSCSFCAAISYDSTPMVMGEPDVSYAFAYPCSNNVCQLIQSLSVEGKIYSDVIRSDAFNSLSIGPDYLFKTNYWAKGVGIIKRVIGVKGTTNILKTYTLVRYN